MSYREHLEHWCETPPTHPEKIPEMPGIELSALTDDALLDLVASTKNVQKLLTERLSVLTAEILDRHTRYGAREIATKQWVSRLERSGDRAVLRRTWLIGLIQDQAATPGEFEKLLPTEVPVNLTGWKMLADRGLKPEENGERRAGTERPKLHARKW